MGLVEMVYIEILVIYLNYVFEVKKYFQDDKIDNELWFDYLLLVFFENIQI